jgi:hypothetical protein
VGAESVDTRRGSDNYGGLILAYPDLSRGVRGRAQTKSVAFPETLEMLARLKPVADCQELLARSVQMAMQLGLSSEDSMRRAVAASPQQQTMLLSLRAAMNQLATEFRGSR